MSAPAPIHSTDAEAIAAAIAHAERRLWLLDVMRRFCMALLETLKPSADTAVVLAFCAISRGARLCIRLAFETERLLHDLKAGILPTPKAARAERTDAKRADPADRKDRAPREAVETESDKGFRARLEALEALLDQDSAGRSAHETAQILCRVLSLNPDWIGWLGDDWLADNLTLTPPAGANAGDTGEGADRRAPEPLHTPPPPLQGPGPPTVKADPHRRLSKRRRRRERARARPARLAGDSRR